MIKGWHKLSLIDYPGCICTTIFLGGCNFRCFYCHNRDIAFNPERFSDVNVAKVFNYLEKRNDCVEGVCISGGEPTIHAELIDLMERLKSMGFKIKLDTNGSRPKVLKEVINKKIVDYVAMDIKAPRDKYEQVSGIGKPDLNLDALQESIDVIKNSGVEYEFRTTVVPKVLKMKDIINIASWIKGSKKYVLQACRGDYGFVSMKDLRRYADVVAPYFNTVEVRG